MFTKIFIFCGLMVFAVAVSAEEPIVSTGPGSQIEVGTGVSQDVGGDAEGGLQLLFHVSLGRRGRRVQLVREGHIVSRITFEGAIDPTPGNESALRWAEVDLHPVFLDGGESNGSSETATVGYLFLPVHLSRQAELENDYTLTINLVGLRASRHFPITELGQSNLEMYLETFFSLLGMNAFSGNLPMQGTIRGHAGGAARGVVTVGSNRDFGFTSLARVAGVFGLSILRGNRYRISLSQGVSVNTSYRHYSEIEIDGEPADPLTGFRLESSLQTKLMIQIRNSVQLFFEYRRQGLRQNLSDAPYRLNVNANDHQHQIMGGATFVY